MYPYNIAHMQFSAPLNLSRLLVVGCKGNFYSFHLRDIHVAVIDLKSCVEISASGTIFSLEVTDGF